MTRDRSDDGTFCSNVNEEDVFVNLDWSGWLTTSEIAQRVGAPHRTVLRHLNNLHESGRIQKRLVHEKLAMWSINNNK